MRTAIFGIHLRMNGDGVKELIGDFAITGERRLERENVFVCPWPHSQALVQCVGEVFPHCSCTVQTVHNPERRTGLAVTKSYRNISSTYPLP